METAKFSHNGDNCSALKESPPGSPLQDNMRTHPATLTKLLHQTLGELETNHSDNICVITLVVSHWTPRFPLQPRAAQESRWPPELGVCRSYPSDFVWPWWFQEESLCRALWSHVSCMAAASCVERAARAAVDWLFRAAAGVAGLLSLSAQDALIVSGRCQSCGIAVHSQGPRG